MKASGRRPRVAWPASSFGRAQDALSLSKGARPGLPLDCQAPAVFLARDAVFVFLAAGAVLRRAAPPRFGDGAASRRAARSSVACSNVSDSGLPPFGSDAFVV